jgi:hypothetical protein
MEQEQQARKAKEWAEKLAEKARQAVRRDLGPEPKIPESVKRAAEIAYGWKFN